MSRLRLLGAVVVALLAGACGNLTSGGFGDLEVVVAVDSVAALQQAPAPAFQMLSGPLVLEPGRQTSSSGMAMLDGTLNMRVQVFALSGRDSATEVTDGVREVIMPLSGAVPVVLARKSLPTGTYLAIRTVFLHVEAIVDGGLIVDGVPIRGPVRVDLGQGSRLVVDTPITLTIDEDVPARVNVDLHTTRWVRLLNQDRRVRAEDFQGQVTVRR